MIRSVILTTLVLVFTLPSLAAERITHFQSDLQVLVDASMEVTETITVHAQGKAIKRGIFRDFPTVYRTASGDRMTVLFEVLGVRRNGAPEPWFTEDRSNGVRVYIGSKDRFIDAGEHQYEIVYRTNRQLGFFDTHDELYWNVTGNGWAFPIDQVVAYVYLPRTVADSQIEFEAYTGTSGSRGRDYEAGIDDEGVAWFRSTRPLAAKEGLTLVTTWPKGHVREPTAQMEVRWFLDDNGHLAIGAIGVTLLLAYYLAMWLRVGRDPVAGAVFPLYEPPPGYSPASMRYVKRMGHDHKSFTAALVNLAVAGHVDIDENKGRYTVTRRQSDAPMAPGEKALLSSLLGGSSSIVIRRSNHERISKALDAHATRLSADYERIYFNNNLGYTLAGIGMSLAMLVSAALLSPDLEHIFPALFLLVWLTGWTFGLSALLKNVLAAWRGVGTGNRVKAVVLTLFSVPFVIGWFVGAGALAATGGLGVVTLTVLLVGINATFYHLMKAPSLRGRKLLDQIGGFQEYLGIAEADELSLRNPPRKTPELFERFLPYAIALDVEEVWGERFASVLAAAKAAHGYHGPNWYHASAPFSATGFSSEVSSGLASSISSSSVAPGSSSGSSSGGGGGSSGGGGGGGGGGGW